MRLVFRVLSARSLIIVLTINQSLFGEQESQMVSFKAAEGFHQESNLLTIANLKFLTNQLLEKVLYSLILAQFLIHPVLDQ